jgi:hypothetical protein
LISLKACGARARHEMRLAKESIMSKAVIEFCHRLETTLLGVEEQLGKAQKALAAGAHAVESGAADNVAQAVAQLSAFRVKAGELAASVRAELPEQVERVQDKLQDFGVEAQTAMRHAVVFLAETASKGAGSAAELLHKGAERAHDLADDLRRDTALTIAAPKQGDEIMPT